MDASKRAHLGAHYTSADDIMLVVDPVVMAPLRTEWEEVRQEVGNLLVEEDRDTARVRLAAFQQRLFEVEVLDPACGSGNFLYLAPAFPAGLGEASYRLRRGLRLEGYEADGQTRPDAGAGSKRLRGRTGPHCPYGSATSSGTRTTASPTTTARSSRHWSPSEERTPSWRTAMSSTHVRRNGPPAEFIIGNPPFLGSKLLRTNLGDDYVDAMFDVYKGRVPAEARRGLLLVRKGQGVGR